MISYVQLLRSKETEELMKYPAAFILLTIIAIRAKRTFNFNIHNLKIGEAFIGDYKTIGLTEQQYRTAKKKLKEWGFATFRGTNKGTIATLTSSNVYNANFEARNGQVNKQVTNKQRTDNGKVTTKKKEKKEKKYNKNNNEYLLNKTQNYEKKL